MIQHILMVNFTHYVCPHSSSTKLLFICNIMFKDKLTCAFKGIGGSNPSAIS